MMLLVDEPGTRRMFVNDMRGPLYSVSYDGKTVAVVPGYQRSGLGSERPVARQRARLPELRVSSAVQPGGTRGFGKFYTYTDTSNTMPAPDFRPGGGTRTHDTVLLEWTAKTPAAATYDGGPPRELIRFEQPFANHNAGQISLQSACVTRRRRFRSAVCRLRRRRQRRRPPQHCRRISGRSSARSCASIRLAPTAPTASTAFPPRNPFVSDGNAATLGEIYAYGVRNPQRFSWDPRNGNMFLADIGQNIVEEISLVTAGANLGWNAWEGSFRFISRNEVGLDDQRGDPKVTYPLVEYGQLDPLLQSSSAVTGVIVYRGTAIPQLANLVVFGDNPSGEMFYFSADKLPTGGQGAIRRILFNDNGASKTLLELIKEKNVKQGKMPATRADLRFGHGPDGQILILNKRDGIIRLLVP